MIEKILAIYQDANSLGFLKGLQARLQCAAEWIPPPAAIGKPQYLNHKAGKIAWAKCRKENADLLVRFTDADADRWQEVRRTETESFPEDARSLVVCGVAVRCPEEWIALDPPYICQYLDLSANDLANSAVRIGRIKSALLRSRRPEEETSQVVARIVSEAPTEVFRRWLQRDDALRCFYNDCRAAALRSNCEVNNEL